MSEQTEKSGGNEDPLMTYFVTLQKESERGKILLLASKIDEMLDDLLTAFFKPKRKPKPGQDNQDPLLGTMRPLNSFAARIEIAYRIGLISEASADCFDLLRKMRNDCAHGLGSFALEQGKHAQNYEQFKKLSYTIAGNGKLFEILENVGLAQEPGTKELSFLMLALNHMLLLQVTQIKLRRVADGFPNMADANFLQADLTKILNKPQ